MPDSKKQWVQNKHNRESILHNNDLTLYKGAIAYHLTAPLSNYRRQQGSRGARGSPKLTASQSWPGAVILIICAFSIKGEQACMVFHVFFSLLLFINEIQKRYLLVLTKTLVRDIEPLTAAERRSDHFPGALNR